MGFEGRVFELEAHEFGFDVGVLSFHGVGCLSHVHDDEAFLVDLFLVGANLFLQVLNIYLPKSPRLFLPVDQAPSSSLLIYASQKLGYLKSCPALSCPGPAFSSDLANAYIPLCF